MHHHQVLIVIFFGSLSLCWLVIGQSDGGHDNDQDVKGDKLNQTLQDAFHEIARRHFIHHLTHLEQVVGIHAKSKVNKSIHELNQEEKDYLLHVHNAYRSAVEPFAGAMMEVVWDDEIAAFAQEWANQCTGTHRPNRNLGTHINMGENIFWSYGASYHEAYAARFWWNEVRWYNHTSGHCVKGKDCGHYITMTWAPTNKIGCAINRCHGLKDMPELKRDAYYFVCDYSGRFYSYQKPYHAHTTPCSHCYKTHAKKCRYNLCVTQEMLDCNIGYNGSTVEIGFNRSFTSSSTRSTTTKCP